MQNNFQIKPPLNLVFFYGRNGAGKDTAAERWTEGNPTRAIISTGDRIKQAQAPEHKFHYLVKEHMGLVAQGDNLPDEVVLNPEVPEASIYPWYLNEAIEGGANTVISTGFPRNQEQYEILQRYLARLGESYDLSVRHVYFDCDEQIARERCLRRGRLDDIPKTIDRRFRIFRETTLPMVESIRGQGKLIDVISEGTPDETQKQLILALEGRAPEVHEPSDEISHPSRERWEL